VWQCYVSGVLLLLCCVEICRKCYAEYLQAQYLSEMLYENATIYVSKVAEVDRTIAHTNDTTVTTTAGHNTSTAAVSIASTSEDYLSVTDEQVLYRIVS